MAKKLDIVGKRYGTLVAISCLGKHNKHGYYKWLCKCDCGKEVIRNSGFFNRAGDKASCGCLKGQRVSIAKTMDFNDFMSAQTATRMIHKAVDHGREFLMPANKVQELIKKPCVYCGKIGGNAIKPCRSKNTKNPHYGKVFRYNGLDRIDSNIGYVEGNVVTCCFVCNRAKGKMPVQEFIQHFKDMVKYQNEKTN